MLAAQSTETQCCQKSLIELPHIQWEAHSHSSTLIQKDIKQWAYKSRRRQCSGLSDQQVETSLRALFAEGSQSRLLPPQLHDQSSETGVNDHFVIVGFLQLEHHPVHHVLEVIPLADLGEFLLVVGIASILAQHGLDKQLHFECNRVDLSVDVEFHLEIVLGGEMDARDIAEGRLVVWIEFVDGEDVLHELVLVGLDHGAYYKKDGKFGWMLQSG